MHQRHCQKCNKSNHCCIFNNTGYCFAGIEDAERIHRHTKIDYRDFLDYSPLPVKTVNALRNDDPALEGMLRLHQMDKDNRLLRLKTKKDRRCIFLNDNNMCSIYEFRPNVCRIYPFWAMRLTNNRIRIIPHDEDPSCAIMKSCQSEECLSEKEKRKIKDLFRKIEKEDRFYRKNMPGFVKENLL